MFQLFPDHKNRLTKETFDRITKRFVNPFFMPFLFGAIIFLFFISGCDLVSRPYFAPVEDELRDIPVLSQNEFNRMMDYQAIKLDTEAKNNSINIDYGKTEVIVDGKAQIKYRMFAKTPTGKCKINKNSYPVLFDTGNFALTHIKVAHVIENKLPYYPVSYEKEDGKTSDFGFAVLKELKIGELTIKNLPVQFDFHQIKNAPFGLSFLGTVSDKTIIIPLIMMNKFKYILFDNQHQLMELSEDKSFVTQDKSNWKSYKLISKNGRISIRSTIEGVEVDLMIDTGCDADLILTETCFDDLIDAQPKLKKSWKLNKTGFLPLAGGNFNYQARLVSDLTFDNRKYNLSTIIAVTNDGKVTGFLDDNGFEGIVGFPFFDESVMVLDFENDILWVKKTKSGRF